MSQAKAKASPRFDPGRPLFHAIQMKQFASSLVSPRGLGVLLAAFGLVVPAAAQVTPYGSGINPAGSLELTAGGPWIGTSFQLTVRDTAATNPPPGQAFLYLASQPAPGFPAGLVLPGLGLGSPGSSGELLLDLLPPNPFLTLGPTLYPGGSSSGANFSLSAPPNPSLVGFNVFAQGLLVTESQGLLLGLTNALEITLGVTPGMPGFTLVGNPTSAGGATWTYVATSGGIVYDLRGKLYKPSAPPAGGYANYPAVIISHGFGGNVNGYSSQIASTMRSWGLVCIMVNLTHAAGVPLGAPGLATEVGSSAANVLRNRKCVDLLQSLGYVDMGRLAAHGHSMGGFATGALLGSHPELFLVASHTAGGMSTQAGAAATSVAQAQAISAPYSLHHGDADTVVPLALDQALANQLAANPTPHQLTVYPGFTHPQIATNAGMLAAVRTWYVQHGLLP